MHVCIDMKMETDRKKNKKLLLMLSEKASVTEYEPARLFFNLLATRKTSGVEKPSPMDPNNPRIIKNQSRLSACMRENHNTL